MSLAHLKAFLGFCDAVGAAAACCYQRGHAPALRRAFA
jgi:hypothetical protein